MPARRRPVRGHGARQAQVPPSGADGVRSETRSVVRVNSLMTYTHTLLSPTHYTHLHDTHPHITPTHASHPLRTHATVPNPTRHTAHTHSHMSPSPTQTWHTPQPHSPHRAHTLTHVTLPNSHMLHSTLPTPHSRFAQVEAVGAGILGRPHHLVLVHPRSAADHPGAAAVARRHVRLLRRAPPGAAGRALPAAAPGVRAGNGRACQQHNSVLDCKSKDQNLSSNEHMRCTKP